MGCSSSTQTHTQGSNRPPAKSIETNGPKKSASSDVSDQIVDDVETIPDQTKLIPLTENEASTNGTPPTQLVEDSVEAIEALELEASEVLAPVTEDCDGTETPLDEESDLVPPVATEGVEKPTEDVEKPTEECVNQDDALTERETEDAVEAEMHEEIASEGPETKEEETGHSADAAEPEIDASDLEE
ncbi:glutamate-rich protein 5 [Discoglossus pictus]